MSVQNLLNTQPPIEHRRPSAGHAAAAGTSFQDQLAQTAASAVIQGPEIHLRKPVENTVFSGGCGGRNNTFQEIYAEYTADSTPENPVVHISGTSDSGPYDFTCHIRDIDPSNASYAEMAALYGHLVKTGAFQSALGSGALPTGLEAGDITARRDYLSMIDRHQSDPHSGGVCQAQAAELLALYQPYASGGRTAAQSASVLDHADFMKEDLLSALYGAKLDMLKRMKESREAAEEQEDWDRLMEYLDAWIETIRKEADIEKTARACADLKEAQENAARNRKDLADEILERLTERLTSD